MKRVEFFLSVYEWKIFTDLETRKCAYRRQNFSLLFSVVRWFYFLIRHIIEIKVMDIFNNGTIKDIMTLPTIGKKRAEQLMAYRIENGGFSSVSA